MSERNKNYRPSREWLLRMAELEDSVQSVAVGGMAEEAGMLRQGDLCLNVLGRLIELTRRKLGFTIEKLSETARVDLADLVRIEDDDAFQPSVRTIYQIAKTLKLPPERLLELAGLVKSSPDENLNEAAVLFAARSETNAKLTRAEKDALDEFVKVLVEGSD